MRGKPHAQRVDALYLLTRDPVQVIERPAQRAQIMPFCGGIIRLKRS